MHFIGMFTSQTENTFIYIYVLHGYLKVYKTNFPWFLWNKKWYMLIKMYLILWRSIWFWIKIANIASLFQKRHNSNKLLFSRKCKKLFPKGGRVKHNWYLVAHFLVYYLVLRWLVEASELSRFVDIILKKAYFWVMILLKQGWNISNFFLT